jgi:DNA polymerase I-like protein with 3'-5' exonuclease and polymerase domains
MRFSTWSDVFRYNKDTGYINSKDVQLTKEVHICNTKTKPKDWQPLCDLFSLCTEFTLDIETYSEKEGGALYFRYGHIRLISVSFFSEGNKHCLLYDTGREQDYNHLKNDYFYSILRKKCGDQDTKVILHNGYFDGSFLLFHLDIKLRNVRDTMLMSQVVWAGVGSRGKAPGISHSLKALSERLGLGDVDKTEQKSDWGSILDTRQLNYAAQDTLLLLDIYKRLNKLVYDNLLTTSCLAECLALPVFIEFAVWGFPIDINKVESSLLEEYSKLEILRESVSSQFPDININSPDQLKKGIKKHYGIDLDDTSKKTLLNLNLDSLTILLKYRSQLKVVRDLEAFKDTEVAWPTIDAPLAVRGHFRQIGPAAMGRSTCSQDISLGRKKLYRIGVQLQNVSKGSALRSVFAAPEGKALIILDLSQCHSRICAQLSKDDALLKIYNEGEDQHLLMAFTLYELDSKAPIKGLSYDEFKNAYRIYSNDPETHKEYAFIKQLRALGKTGNYSGLNQAGAIRIQDALEKAGVQASIEQCKQIQLAWRATYARLYNFIKDMVNRANNQTICFDFLPDRVYGSVRGLTNRIFYSEKRVKLNDKYNKAQVAYTNTISSLWLTSEADMIKMSMGLVLQEFDKKPLWQARFVEFTHDEYGVMIDEEYALEGATLCQDITHKILKKYIKVIPVDDNFDPSKLICKSWSEK